MEACLLIVTSMTPEERFLKIENALKYASGLYAQHAEAIRRHDEDIRELRKMHKGMVLAITKVAEAQPDYRPKNEGPQ